VKIRAATPEDAAAIAHVSVTTWQAAYRDVFGDALDALSVDEATERRRAWLEAAPERAFTLVGELYGRIEGFANAGAAIDDAQVGQLYAIYVLPQAWGTGLGHALMEAAVAGLRERGFEDAIVDVLTENPRARRFYEREGWSFAEEHDAEFLGIAVREARYRRRLDA
jgi:GNAT superfamily N-acetyltransferase